MTDHREEYPMSRAQTAETSVACQCAARSSDLGHVRHRHRHRHHANFSRLDSRHDRRHPARPPVPDRGRAAPAAGGEGRVVQPGRLGQGPRRGRPDRGGRARRPPQAGRDDRRADLRQHRDRPGHRGSAQGLPRDRGDARQDVAREDRPAARLRRRRRARPDRRSAGVPPVLLPGGRPAHRRDPRRVPAQPVFQPGQPPGPLRVDRPRDLGADGGSDHSSGRRRGNGRHDHRHRPLPARAQAGPHRDRRRPRGFDLLRRARQRPSLPGRRRGRGLLAGDVRPEHRRSLDHRVGQGCVPDHPAAGPARGHPGRRLGRPGAPRRHPDCRRNRRPAMR